MRHDYTPTETDQIHKLIQLQEEIGKLKDKLLKNHNKKTLWQKIWKVRNEMGLM